MGNDPLVMESLHTKSQDQLSMRGIEASLNEINDVEIDYVTLKGGKECTLKELFDSLVFNCKLKEGGGEQEEYDDEFADLQSVDFGEPLNFEADFYLNHEVVELHNLQCIYYDILHPIDSDEEEDDDEDDEHINRFIERIPEQHKPQEEEEELVVEDDVVDVVIEEKVEELKKSESVIVESPTKIIQDQVEPVVEQEVEQEVEQVVSEEVKVEEQPQVDEEVKSVQEAQIQSSEVVEDPNLLKLESHHEQVEQVEQVIEENIEVQQDDEKPVEDLIDETLKEMVAKSTSEESKDIQSDKKLKKKKKGVRSITHKGVKSTVYIINANKNVTFAECKVKYNVKNRVLLVKKANNTFELHSNSIISNVISKPGVIPILLKITIVGQSTVMVLSFEDAKLVEELKTLLNTSL